MALAKSMLRNSTAWLAPLVLLAAGCKFDTSSVISRDATSPGHDATLAPDAIAPKDCPADIFIQLSVNGKQVALGPGLPFAQVLLGDTVELSAVGTCTRSGPIFYEWSVEPSTAQVGSTALPNLESQTLTVYPSKAETYNVRLKVRDSPASTPLEKEVFGFSATGFSDLPFVPNNQIKALHAGANSLWIGSVEGAFQASLQSPFIAPNNGNYAAINQNADGDSIPSDVRDAYESPTGEYAWFGTDQNDGIAYRLSLSTANPSVSAIPIITGARSKAIGGTATEIRFATDKGVALLSQDSTTFSVERADHSEALSTGSVGNWSGAHKLYPLPSGEEIDIFGGDNKIRALADDGTDLWVGSDTNGVARLRDGLVEAIYESDNSGLQNNKIRSIAVDAGGDIWVASQGGVHRFKKDRQVWLALPSADRTGLDLKALTIDESDGRRAIYTGGPAGLMMMRSPPLLSSSP